MTIQLRNSEVTRRGLMVGAAGLTFAVACGLRFVKAQTARGTSVALSPWVTISTDDTVAIMSPAAWGRARSRRCP